MGGRVDGRTVASVSGPRASLLPDATEAEVPAALLVIRMLREELDHDELKLTSPARGKRITWAHIAHGKELSGRQAAERRHLQLSRAHTRPDGSVRALSATLRGRDKYKANLRAKFW